MSAQPSPGADELRTRAHLRAHHVRPFGHDTPRGTAMPSPTPGEPPWWSVGKEPAAPPPPTPDTTAPGVHVHITPPPEPPAVDHAAVDRRARARRWFLAHGAAAGTGWTFGLHDAITHGLLEPTGNGATAAGLALAGFGWFGAEFVGERYVRVLPSRVRPPVLWALRIPMATALLATALHAPNALI